MNKRLLPLKIGLVTYILLIGCIAVLEAQALTGSEENVAKFRAAKPGRATIEVDLWGVSRPGQYEIEVGTDLLKLLTYAGGPDIGQRDEFSRKDIYIRLYRKNEAGSERGLVYEVLLDQIIANQEAQQAYLSLQNGDLIAIETVSRKTFNWRDALSIVTSLGTVALLVIRISQGN